MGVTFRGMPTPALLIALQGMYPEHYSLFLRKEPSPTGEKRIYSAISNDELKEDGVEVGENTRHGRFLVSSRDLDWRDHFLWKGSPLQPAGGFLVHKNKDWINLHAQPGDEDWVKVEGGRVEGLARVLLFERSGARDVEGVVVALVITYTLLAVAMMLISGALQQVFAPGCSRG